MVVAKPLAAEGLGCVRPGVVHPSVSQVEQGREGAPERHENLASLRLVPGGQTTGGLLHLRVALQELEGHAERVAYHHTLGEVCPWVDLDLGDALPEDSG